MTKQMTIGQSISIEICQGQEDEGMITEGILIAICNDGTVIVKLALNGELVQGFTI